MSELYGVIANQRQAKLKRLQDMGGIGTAPFVGRVPYTELLGHLNNSSIGLPFTSPVIANNTQMC